MPPSHFENTRFMYFHTVHIKRGNVIIVVLVGYIRMLGFFYHSISIGWNSGCSSLVLQYSAVLFAERASFLINNFTGFMWLFILGLYTLKRVVAKIGRKMRIRAESVLIASLFIPVQHLFIFFIPVGYQQEVTLNNALILSLVV